LVIDFLEKMAKTGKRFGSKKILLDKEKLNKYIQDGRLTDNEQFGFCINGELSFLDVEQTEEHVESEPTVQTQIQECSSQE
jgi:hypothetical protein